MASFAESLTNSVFVCFNEYVKGNWKVFVFVDSFH